MTAVYEVDPAGYAAGRALFESAHVSFDRPYWEAAFDGDFPGRLFVDDPDRPTAALLARTYEYFLAGDASPALIAFLADAPASANPLEWFYGYVPLTESWLAAMLSAFPDFYQEARRAFRLGAGGAERARSWRSRVPDGVRVEPLDPALARRAETEVPFSIEPLLLSLDRFDDRSFGFAAIDATRNQVISVAFTAGVSRQEVNLAVGTAYAARKRGLATLLCQACCNRAESSGLEVTWDCDRVNVASGMLAESLGFIEEPSFVEFAFPDPEKGMPHRLNPTPSGIPWSAAPMPNGVTRWTRES